MNDVNWNDIYQNGGNYWQFPDLLLDELLNNFPPYQHVLDVGCGKGELVRQLLVREYMAEGIDLSFSAVALSDDLLKSGFIHQADVMEMKMRKFDIIFLKFVLSFIYDKDRLLMKLKNNCQYLILLVAVLQDEVAYDEKALKFGIREVELTKLLEDNFTHISLFYAEMGNLLTERRIYILR